MLDVTFFDYNRTTISLLSQPVRCRREHQRLIVFKPADRGFRGSGHFDFQNHPLALGYGVRQKSPAHDGREHVF